MVNFLAAAIIIAANIRLVNYGRWAYGQGYKRGAIGIYVIAFVSLVFPLIMLYRAAT